jgi:endonuclease/exonuclease/phosphatase (EEP) superfamily protein YafD
LASGLTKVVFATHAFNPKKRNQRRAALGAIHLRIQALNADPNVHATIVMGDFNSPPSELIDLFPGCIIGISADANLSTTKTGSSIDNLLGFSGLIIDAPLVLPDIGGDHFPVLFHYHLIVDDV